MEFRYLLKCLMLPPLVQIIALMAAWGMRKRRPKMAWVVSIFAVFSLWALGTPVVATYLALTVEQAPALDPEKLDQIKADAIVVLSSSQLRYAPEFGQAVSGEGQLSRVRYGAWVHRRTGLPVLLSGGSVTGSEERTLAETMAYDLREGYGVLARWLEIKSRTTMENALSSYEILVAQGKTSILLITHSIHMKRAKWAFEKAGFAVQPAPTNVVQTNPLGFYSFLPNAKSLKSSTEVLHEWIGYVVYRIHY